MGMEMYFTVLTFCAIQFVAISTYRCGYICYIYLSFETTLDLITYFTITTKGVSWLTTACKLFCVGVVAQHKNTRWTSLARKVPTLSLFKTRSHWVVNVVALTSCRLNLLLWYSVQYSFKMTGHAIGWGIFVFFVFLYISKANIQLWCKFGT